MTKYIIYYEDANEMGDEVFESAQEVLQYARRSTIMWLISHMKFKEDPTRVHPFTTMEEAEKFESPCELCERRVHCMVQDHCEHSAIIWEFPDEVTMTIRPQLFFGSSLIQDFLDKVPGVRTCRANFVGKGSLVYD